MEAIQSLISAPVAFLIMGLILAALQFLYRYWDKQDTKEIAKMLEKSINRIVLTVNEGVHSFDPHVERAKLTHEWMYQMKETQSVKDSTGLPLIYRNVTAENTLEELVKIAHKSATTEMHISEILKNIEERQTKQEEKIEKLSDRVEQHQSTCTKQYNDLKDQHGKIKL